MDSKILAIAVLEQMRSTLGEINPQFSYWKRRVDVALVNEEELSKLLSKVWDGEFYD